MMLRGLLATLTPEPSFEVVGSAFTGAEALRLFRELRPDITIMDVTLTPEMTGTEATLAIRREFPEALIIMLSVRKGDQDIQRALRAGARSYLFKDMLGDRLVDTIRQVHAGAKPVMPEAAQILADHLLDPPLTARELDVLQLLGGGLSNKEIAQQLGVSVYTVQGHVKSIFTKLKVTDRSEAVITAIRRGIIHLH
jgi:DNA-binding NarL/FixJ family response regulator